MSDLKYDPQFDELMKAIGRVAAIWAQFEFYLSETMWELMNVERKAGACVTAQMFGTAPRFRAIAALMHMRGANQALIDEMNVFSGRAQAVGDRRHRFMHDPWQINHSKEFERLHLKADRKLEFEFKLEDMKQIDKTYTDVFKLLNDFEDFRLRMVDALPSFSRTQYAQSPGIATRPRRKGSES